MSNQVAGEDNRVYIKETIFENILAESFPELDI